MGRGKEGREDAVPSAKCSLNREKRTIVGKEGVKKKKKKNPTVDFFFSSITVINM